MTGPVSFGDLIDQARHHLDAAGRIPGRPGNEQDLLDATRGMHAIVTVISQYFRDIMVGYAKPSARKRRTADRSADPAEQWAAAFLLARRAALMPPGPSNRPPACDHRASLPPSADGT